MKKTILILFALCHVCHANAQLRIDTLGNMGLGIDPQSSFRLSMYSSRGGLRSISNDTRSDYTSTGVEGIGYMPYHGRAYGLKGTATPYSGSMDGRNYGVFGYAERSTSGENFGVYGTIGPNGQGAGVYGSTYYEVGEFGLLSRYAGFFHGDVRVTGNLVIDGDLLYSSSHLYSVGDSRGSENAARYTESLQQLSVNTYTYNPFLSYEDLTAEIGYDDDMVQLLSNSEKQAMTKLHYGLDVNRLEIVFPDLVYDNADGTKSINYIEMVPILVQAINELQQELDELRGNSGQAKKAIATGNGEISDAVTMLSMGQNNPNPFSNITTIEVNIPEIVQNAFIYIYDLQGKKLQQVDITSRGKQSVSIDASSYVEGMYLYSLIADGKVVDTRRMIVEH